MTRKDWTLIVAALLLTTLPAVMFARAGRIQAAQGTAGKSEKPNTQTLKIDVELVLVNATVTDPLNRYVSGLEAEHFQISEDRVEQKIEYFSAEDVPVSVGIILDVSGREVLDQIGRAHV